MREEFRKRVCKPSHLVSGARALLVCCSGHRGGRIQRFLASTGCLMSSASGQKLFCEVCSAFKLSFDEYVGDKMVPPHSSAILAPSLLIV